MDLNGDGQHDWKDDALFGFIVNESTEKKPEPHGDPSGSGCGTLFCILICACGVGTVFSAVLH